MENVERNLIRSLPENEQLDVHFAILFGWRDVRRALRAYEDQLFAQEVRIWELLGMPEDVERATSEGCSEDCSCVVESEDDNLTK